ncbi:MAG: cytochrome c biogenesis protein ResB [Planctomycetes bacterium]|nr:cytochrome c biogenesis protein ResB [Planctomycetota bacterium]
MKRATSRKKAATIAKPAETNGQAPPVETNGTPVSDAPVVDAGLTKAAEANGTMVAPAAPVAAPSPEPDDVPQATFETAADHPAYKVLVMLADLRITVVLFALSLVLVFWGTLAQVDNGVWTVVHKYFRSAFVFVPLKVVFFNCLENSEAVIPFPGGWLIGAAMFVNLLAAHAVRFSLSWARAGILLTHAGIIVMMVGEVITGLAAQEGQMVIMIGQTGNTVIDNRTCELAIIHTLDDKKDDVVAISSRRLYEGAVVEHDKVPFKIEVTEFMANTKLLDNAKNRKADKGFGRVHVAEPVPEVSGVDPKQTVDLPSIYATLTTRDGKPLGKWLFSTRFGDPQWLEVDGKKYQVILRFKQSTLDYNLHLTDFKHDVFAGTQTAKDFHAYVRLIDPTTQTDRPVEIYMNSPLYYRGRTFYQSSWTTDERTGKATGTILQVVSNPGWLLPYISCGIAGIGLLIHFGITLYRFLGRRTVV